MTSAFDVQPFAHLKRAGRIPDRFGGDMGVACRRAQLGVAQQHLNNPDVNVGLQQMGRKTVP